MSRALPIVVVLAAAALWGIAMLGPERDAPRVAAAGPQPEATLPPAAEPVARPPREARPEPAPQRPPKPAKPTSGRTAQQEGRDKPLDMGLEPAMLVDSDINQRHTGAGLSGRQDRVEQLGDPPPRREFDLGEGYLSPEFVEYQTDYAYEPRDGRWARPKEKRIRDLLRAAGLGPYIHVVNCRESVCRVQVEVEEGDSLGRLLEVPGLAAELGIDENTPYSLRANQLSLYARRGGPATASK